MNAYSTEMSIDMKPEVSVVIPNYNGAEYLNNCIESLYNQTFDNFEIIVIDDCSKDDSMAKAMEAYPERTDLPSIRYVKRPDNGGFCKAVNEGIRLSKAPYVLLLNNDTVAMPGFVEAMYRAIRGRKKVFSVSARMIAMHDKSVLDDTGDLYCALGWAFAPAKDKSINLYKKKEQVFASCGGAAIYRKQVFEQIGLFDESHFAYLEDIDIGYRAKLYGYQNIYEPKAEVLHAGSAVSGSRHNDFKVRISARNNLFVIYKNMPDWQLLVNAPFLVAGILIKILFFARKGMALSYIMGIKDGILHICGNVKNMRKVDFKKVPLGRQILIEEELLRNVARRVKG